MRRFHQDDVIAAIATPIGEGALGVIRVSGAGSITAIDNIFRGSRRLQDAATHTVHHGWLIDQSGTRIDEVLATVFRSPRSYTGEDSVEIGCHGSIFVMRQVLSCIVTAGARQAEPGEFTKRAFLNGKMDLSQAEAVSALIASRSERAHHSSMSQLQGRFSEKIKTLRSSIVNLVSTLELELDFSEEGIELLPKQNLVNDLSAVIEQIQGLMDTYRFGRVSREGVSVAIVGRPNAGKSSLFNALLREQRAIVTDVPGTTRDSLEESISIDGILFRLNDTAGLRESADLVEREGIQRTKNLLKGCDIVLLVVDASDERDCFESAEITEAGWSGLGRIVVLNKIDIARYREVSYDCKMIAVSAKTGWGLDKLRAELISLAKGDASGEDGIFVANDRHHRLLGSARNSLSRALDALNIGLTSEFVSVEMRQAVDALAEIVGDVSSDDILNEIFSKFCIGK